MCLCGDDGVEKSFFFEFKDEILESFIQGDSKGVERKQVETSLSERFCRWIVHSSIVEL